ncbi:MAG: hypothetical protein ACJAZX_001163 [Rickettsiales bacterium]|jgi:hypothetical protein
MTKLEQAKENLSAAFGNLEKTIFDKIGEIRKLNNPSNRESMGIETQNNKLRIKNDQLEESKAQNKEIIHQIQMDFSQIKKIINQNDNS